MLLEFRESKGVIAFENAEDIVQFYQARRQSLVGTGVRLVTDVEAYHANHGSSSDPEKAYLCNSIQRNGKNLL